MSAAFLPDQFNRAHGFSVEIGGSSGGDDMSGNDGAWKSVSHSGIQFEVEKNAVTIGPDQYGMSTLGRTNWGTIELVGELTNTRKAVKEIYKNMLQKGAADDVYVTITVIWKKPDGSDGHQVAFEECFLTSYTMSALNSSEENVPCLEYSTWQVGYSLDFLG